MSEANGQRRTSLLRRIRRLVARFGKGFGHSWLLAVFISPFVVYVYLKATMPPGTERGEAPPLDWGGLPLDYASLKWLAIASTVLFLGALGSTVSVYSRQDLAADEPAPKRTIFGVQLLGAVFASLLMLAFIGGLIQGSLFPQFELSEGWHYLRFYPDSWARLMVWSFIAGFSERFVPDLLRNLIMQGGDENRERANREPVPE